MLKSVKLLFALMSLTASMFLSSCASESDSFETAESKTNLEVVYSVEFPFIKDKTLLKWFPTEYKAILGKHELYGEMNSKMNVICNRFYANEKEKVIFQTLENMSGNYSCIICSFAMHLCPKEKLYPLVIQLFQHSENLVILTPHKRPELELLSGVELVFTDFAKTEKGKKVFLKHYKFSYLTSERS